MTDEMLPERRKRSRLEPSEHASEAACLDGLAEAAAEAVSVDIEARRWAGDASEAAPGAPRHARQRIAVSVTPVRVPRCGSRCGSKFMLAGHRHSYQLISPFQSLNDFGRGAPPITRISSSLSSRSAAKRSKARFSAMCPADVAPGITTTPC